MSNILKGIINETSPHDYDSDWDYQDAVARSGKSRSSYRSQEDDTFDADVAYSKKMYQLGQQQKAAKEKAQRDSDHDRLASGTNEDITEASNPYEPVMIQGYDKWLKLVNIPNVDKHAYKSDITAVTSLGDIIGEFNTDKDLGYVIKKYVKKGMAEAGTGLDIDRSIPGRTIARISGTSPDPAIGKLRRNPHAKKLSDFNDSDEYDQWSGKVGPSIHDDEEDTFDTDYTGDEDGTLKEISNEKLAQYKTAAALDAGKADKEGDYKRADKRFSGIVKATKKQFANDTKQSAIGQGVAEEIRPTTGQAMNIRKQTTKKMNSGNKFVWKRPNQINGSHTEQELLSMGFKKSTKYNMWGGTQDMWNRLSSELDENLGDQLKSKSLEALTLLKQQIEQKRAEDLAQWEKDFKQNTVAKFTAREPNLRQRATSTPMVAMPGEKHSDLKARLSQLNKAIEKQGILDNLVQKLDKKGLLTPNIEAGVDTSMLARDGARDNYVELNKKLDKALEYVKNRLLTNKAAYAKPKAIDEDVEMLDEGVLNRLGSIALGLVLAFGASHSMAEDMYVYQDAATQKLRIATSLDKVPMNALMSFKVDTDSKTVSMIKGNQETPIQVQPAVVKQAQQQASGQTQQPQTQQPQQPTISIQSILDKVKTSMSNNMIDPESTKYRDIKVYDTTDKGENPVWLITGQFNAKNRMGGYVGNEGFYVVINQSTNLPVAMDFEGKNPLQAGWMQGKYKKGIERGKLVYDNGQLVNERDLNEDDSVPTRMRMNDYLDLADTIQKKLRQAIKMGDKARIQELNKQRDELDARVKKHGMMPESVDEADMNRRGFLGKAGAGALAAAGLGGASNAQAFKGTLPAPAPSISKDEAEAQLEELRSKTYKELASMVWGVWPRILDTTFGGLTSADKPATPEQIGKMLGYRLAEYAEEYRQKVRAIKVAAGVKDPQSLNKTTGPVYVNEQDIDEEKQRLDPKCWKGYKKQGTKMKGDTRVNNCVPVKETKSHILAGLQQIDEGWKDKLGAAAIAGSMALGAAGANADTRRVTPDGQGNFTGGMKPTATVQAEPAPSTPSTATIPGQGLVRAERADRQAGTVTVDGQEYKMIMLEPGGIRPRGGQQIVIPQAVMGERGMGNYMAILAGGRVFVLPRNE